MPVNTVKIPRSFSSGGSLSHVLLRHDVHEAAFDVEFLDDGLALKGSGHFLVGFGQFQRAGFIDVCWDVDAVLDLAADLDGDLDGLIDTLRFVVSRPGDGRKSARR